MSLLYFAKINDYEKCMKILTLKDFIKQKPVLINYKGSNDWCPLHYASLNGNTKLVDLLLVNEAQIDAETSSKLTPLMIACQKF
jgi:ankyrin repeat protein